MSIVGVFTSLVLLYLIWKQNKNFNKSITILESRINQQQHQINRISADIQELKR